MAAMETLSITLQAAPAVVAAVVGAVVAGGISTAATVLLTPGPPELPEPVADEQDRLGNAADEEARRRRAANPQQINSMAVGAPAVSVGSPTVVLGG